MKNKILKTTMFIIGIVFLISACCLDSENWILFLIVMVLSGSILYLFLRINEKYFLKMLDKY